MKLNDKLKKLDSYPFHMPGHKRNGRFGIAGAEIDITEIKGFDNLHSAKGVLLDIENRLSSHYKSEKSFMLVGGSTVGILSAIHTLCSSGDKIIIARNCHKSVFNACSLLRLRVVYVEPEYDGKCGYYKEVTQQALDTVIRAHNDASAVVITSPTYEGMLSNISCKLPLIVDAAHGAHLGIKPFPDYPKGDIVISSLHKTLPALTMTAVANIYNDKYTAKFKRYLDIFETSSPSYVLMNSVDICTQYLENCAEDFDAYYSRLTALRKMGLMWLEIRHSDDIGKLVISTADASINAQDLAQALRERYAIEVEAALSEHVILMTSPADTDEAFARLKAALCQIDSECDKKSFRRRFRKPPCPADAVTIFFEDCGDMTEIENAVGKRACEFVYAYPPDIPLLIPNEIISAEMSEYISGLINSNVNVESDSGLLPKVLTKQA
ncbi:MAG: amino acid decarboxylase [Eubacterium sp.]|nr:amino acid decarboxylase [Eubacterium sp.]